MIPQNSRSPMRNQRWVECQGSDLAFGDCVRITNSIRSETGAFSDGIRTIFQVDDPNKDSQPNTIIIGHMSGAKGYCTNDFPTYAKCDQTAVPGDEVGPVAGSRVLSKQAKGYLVMGDVQNGMARVRRLDRDDAATIVGTLLTDRTRELIGGLTLGRANVIITGKVGTAGDAIGTTVPVFFGDERWLEAVTGCKVIADYVYDPVLAASFQLANPWFWIVKECQGLAAGFWALTQEDRATGAPTQDVLVTLIQQTGHANDDYPPELWFGQSSGQGSCGNITIGCRVDPNSPVSDDPVTGQPRGRWSILTPCGTGCSSTYEDFQGLPCILANSDITAPCSGGGQQTGSRELKVRFLAGTFPRMVSGAMCYVVLDNDIANTTDNSTMRYYVNYSQELVDAISGVLPQDSCKVDFTVTVIQHDSPWPHNQPIPANMLPLTIRNSRHAGLTGDSWAATWSDAEQAYVCIDMEKHEVTMTSGITSTFDEQTNCTVIAAQNRQAYVELCSNAVTPVTLLSYRSEAMKLVDTLEFSKGQTGDSGSGQEQCDPILRLKWIGRDILTLCTGSTYGEEEVALSTKNVVVGFVEVAGCAIPVYQEIITLGDCGTEFQGSAIICVVDFECPTGSGSGSGQ